MPELSAEGAVLFEQIGDRVRVALVEPRGEGEEEKAHGRRINHGGQHSAERLAFDGRLINGTLRDGPALFLLNLTVPRGLMHQRRSPAPRVVPGRRPIVSYTRRRTCPRRHRNDLRPV